jgi:multimeric flavodoxin WrbA/putative sterol carrier protein
MQALVVSGSPRGRNSSSYHVAEWFIRGLKRAGADVAEILLKEHKINHCLGCFACWTKTPGKCVHRDDMDTLLPMLINSDLVVFAIPLYTFSVPGLVKDFLDRHIPILEPYIIFKNGISSHPYRKPSKRRKIFLISVAGFPERSHFDAQVAMFKKIFNSPESEYIGEILIGGAEMMSREKYQKVFTSLYTLIEKGGYEIGRYGALSDETKNAIIAENTFSKQKTAHFIKTANRYWKSFESLKSRKVAVPEEKSALSVSDGGMKSFMAGMALQYSPDSFPGFEGVLQFDFEGECYNLVISDAICRAYEGEYPNPDLTIRSPKKVWLDIAEGKLDGTEAYMEELYKAEGKFQLLMKMDQMFPSDRKKETVSDKEQEADKDIQEERGPIKLTGMAWMTVAFFPWILKWVWGSVSSGPVPHIAACGTALIIAIYHIFSNRVTVFEGGSAIYLFITAALHTIGFDFFLKYAEAIDYLFLGGLWLGSLAGKYSLTAEYSRLQYPKPVWHTRAFQSTNAILTAAWGVYFLAAVIIKTMFVDGFFTTFPWMYLTYFVLPPMFVFTSLFQKRYPEMVMKKG